MRDQCIDDGMKNLRSADVENATKYKKIKRNVL